MSQRGRRGVGWCEGVVYLTSPGRPTDIGLQLGKACYPCSREGLRGNVFISASLLLVLFSFFPVPLFHLLYYLFYLSSPFFLGDDTK